MTSYYKLIGLPSPITLHHFYQKRALFDKKKRDYYIFSQFIETLFLKSGIQRINSDLFKFLFPLDSFLNGLYADTREKKPIHRQICFDNDLNKLHLTPEDLACLERIDDGMIFDAAHEAVCKYSSPTKTIKSYIYNRSPKSLHNVPYATNFAQPNEQRYQIEFLTNITTGRIDSLLSLYHKHRQKQDFSGSDKQKEYRITGLDHKLLNRHYEHERQSLTQALNKSLQAMTIVDQPDTIKPGTRAGIVLILPDGRIALHHVKSPEKDYAGFARKVYEFSRGDCTTDTLSKYALQETALTELYKKLGVLGDVNTLEFLCDIDNFFLMGKPQETVRYYVMKSTQLTGSFVWDRGNLDGKSVNETKSVVLTPFKNLSRLFLLNIQDYTGVGSTDMQVLTFLERYLKREKITEIPSIETHTLISKCDLCPVTFSAFLKKDAQEIDSFFNQFVQFKQHYFHQLFIENKTSDSITHFDTVYGRINSANSIPEFASDLRQFFSKDPEFNELLLRNKLRHWMEEKCVKLFSTKSKGLFTHFSMNPNLLDKLQEQFHTVGRVPLVCLNYFSKQIPSKSFFDYTFGYAMQMPMPLLFSSFIDCHSNAFFNVFNSFEFRNELAQASTEKEMEDIVLHHIFSGDRSLYSDVTKKYGTYTTFSDFIGRKRPFFASDVLPEYKNFDWPEHMGLGHIGLILGIMVHPDKTFDIALKQHDLYLKNYGIDLPLLILDYEKNELKTLSRENIIIKMFNQKQTDLDTCLNAEKNQSEYHNNVKRSLESFSLFYLKYQENLASLGLVPFFTPSIYLSSVNDYTFAYRFFCETKQSFNVELPFLYTRESHQSPQFFSKTDIISLFIKESFFSLNPTKFQNLLLLFSTFSNSHAKELLDSYLSYLNEINAQNYETLYEIGYSLLFCCLIHNRCINTSEFILFFNRFSEIYHNKFDESLLESMRKFFEKDLLPLPRDIIDYTTHKFLILLYENYSNTCILPSDRLGKQFYKSELFLLKECFLNLPDVPPLESFSASTIQKLFKNLLTLLSVLPVEKDSHICITNVIRCLTKMRNFLSKAEYDSFSLYLYNLDKILYTHFCSQHSISELSKQMILDLPETLKYQIIFSSKLPKSIFAPYFSDIHYCLNFCIHINVFENTLKNYIIQGNTKVFLDTQTSYIINLLNQQHYPFVTFESLKADMESGLSKPISLSRNDTICSVFTPFIEEFLNKFIPSRTILEMKSQCFISFIENLVNNFREFPNKFSLDNVSFFLYCIFRLMSDDIPRNDSSEDINRLLKTFLSNLV